MNLFRGEDPADFHGDDPADMRRLRRSIANKPRLGDLVGTVWDLKTGGRRIEILRVAVGDRAFAARDQNGRTNRLGYDRLISDYRPVTALPRPSRP